MNFIEWAKDRNMSGMECQFAKDAWAASAKEFPDLGAVIRWLKNGCNVEDAVKELELYQNAMRSNVKLRGAPLLARPSRTPG